MNPLLAMQGLLVVTIAVGFSGALLAWKERPEPGSVALTTLLAGQCWWSATLFFQVTAGTLSAKVFWVSVSWVGISVLPVAWLFFCLTYTGYTQFRRPRYVALAAVVPAVTVVLGLTDGYHHLVYTDASLVRQAGHLTLVQTPGPWFWVIAGYTYLLGLLGAIPLLQFIRSEVTTFRGQSVALLVGLVAPWVTNASFLVGMVPTAGVDPTPVAFSLSAVAFLGALTRFQLFGTSPAPIRPARRSVFDRMEGGIVVLDRNENVVDLNDRAAEALGARAGEWLGNPIEDAIPQFDNVTGDQSGQPVIRPGNGRTYDVSASRLTDAHGRTTGHLVTLNDISEYVRQQQRLEVLNRLFRHNVRTNVQIIVSHADHFADQGSERRAAEARDKALEIEAFSDKIRTVLDVFEQGRTEVRPVRLGTVLEGCVETVRAEHPEVAVETALDADGLYVDSVLDDVLSNVVENAAQHNTGAEQTVWVDAARQGDRAEITVADDGPGITDDELSLLEEETETPLRHGSGIGLALVAWGTEIAGGNVTFADNDPTGTVVTLEVPLLSPPAATE
jgi:signal transduction histidine kinase